VDEGEAVARLSCAHPNPFGPSTTIRYVAPRGGHVSVRVYDLAGRAVATLVDGAATPGEHVAVWDGATDSGERAASGVYFVRLEAEGTTGASAIARKLVLLK
jgi:flagellar hook assembly protein FlgD